MIHLITLTLIDAIGVACIATGRRVEVHRHRQVHGKMVSEGIIKIDDECSG